MNATSFADRLLEAGLYPRNVFRQFGLGFPDISYGDASPLFDGVHHKVGMLFTSRSGTTFFVDALNRTGMLGNVREHMNRYMIRRGERSWGVTSMREYVAESVRKNTSSNGVYGFKGTAEALLPLVQVNELPEHAREWAWITVRRRDIIAQAVSLHRAMSTGVWHDRGGSEEQPPLAEFDFKAVMDKLQSIQQRQAQNDRFFAHMGIEPLSLIYEDFRDEPVPAIEAVFEHVGVAPPANLEQIATEGRYRVLQNPDTEAYIDRFRAEFENKLKDY